MIATLMFEQECAGLENPLDLMGRVPEGLGRPYSLTNLAHQWAIAKYGLEDELTILSTAHKNQFLILHCSDHDKMRAVSSYIYHSRWGTDEEGMAVEESRCYHVKKEGEVSYRALGKDVQRRTIGKELEAVVRERSLKVGIIRQQVRMMEKALEVAKQQWRRVDGRWESLTIDKDCAKAVETWAGTTNNDDPPQVINDQGRVPWRSPTNWEYWMHGGQFLPPRAPMPPLPYRYDAEGNLLWHSPIAPLWYTTDYRREQTWWRHGNHY
jgi:hypothetical protein